MKTDKTKVKRIPKRGFYDKETIIRILDNDFVCQIGFVYNNYPVVIPTIYGRKDDILYFHGASVSRMLQTLEKGVSISLNVTKTKGIVLARSAFHHSLNYESVTIFGNATLVENDKDKLQALQIISDQIIPERWEEVRAPNKKELNITKVLQLKITEASAKIRNEGVGDDKEDYELDIWAGILPIEQKYGKPIADELLKEGIEISNSVKKLIK
jgi:nitroimidazol reductase NimA-like FMN-containing flavoprotein (pyridoxamine 5'-phosphate oxidase superfamily)